MEASINERHLKDFIRLLQCASKFGDELCIAANKDLWEMAVTNSTKSAYCLFKLQPLFFSRYKARGSPQAQKRGVKCQLLVKSVLAVVGKASAANHIERLDLLIHDPHDGLRSKRRKESSSASGTTDASRSSVNGEEEDEREDDVVSGRESMLVVRLVCRHGVTKKHSLYLSHSEFLRADVDPRSTPSGFTIPARTLRDWLDHFSLSTGSGTSGNAAGARPDNQLGWLFGKNEVRIKSWEGSSKGMCTELKLEAAEFGTDQASGEDRYWLQEDRVDLTIPMKEFSAALQLADSLNIELAIAFSEPTQPLTMIYSGVENDCFDIFCAIATTNCDAFQGVNLNSRGSTGGGGGGSSSGGGGGGGGVGGGGQRRDNLDRFPPGISPSKAGQKRTESDLSDVDPPRENGAQAGQNSRNERRVSDTPTKRRPSKLELTPARDGSQIVAAPAILYTSVSQAPAQPVAGPSRLGSRKNGNGIVNADANDDGDGGDVNEPLFLPGGSQDHDAPPPGTNTARPLTQAEILEMTGLDVENLAADLDEADEEEWRASQAQKPHRPLNDDEMELDREEEEAAAAEAQAREEEERRLREVERDLVQGRFEADGDIFNVQRQEPRRSQGQSQHPQQQQREEARPVSQRPTRIRPARTSTAPTRSSQAQAPSIIGNGGSHRETGIRHSVHSDRQDEAEDEEFELGATQRPSPDESSDGTDSTKGGGSSRSFQAFFDDD